MNMKVAKVSNRLIYTVIGAIIALVVVLIPFLVINLLEYFEEQSLSESIVYDEKHPVYIIKDRGDKFYIGGKHQFKVGDDVIIPIAVQNLGNETIYFALNIVLDHDKSVHEIADYDLRYSKRLCDNWIDPFEVKSMAIKLRAPDTPGIDNVIVSVAFAKVENEKCVPKPFGKYAQQNVKFEVVN